MKRELLVGCGSARDRRISPAGASEDWNNLVTLDFNGDHHPDVVADLTQYPYPFADDSFSEVHAYEVLEHLGSQGDYASFFDQFSEFWRILEPDGLFCATVPWWEDRWAWADPGHTRVITPDTLGFLSQAFYEETKDNANTDYRFCYSADFEPVYGEKIETDVEKGAHMLFVLKAIKSSRFELRVL